MTNLSPADDPLNMSPPPALRDGHEDHVHNAIDGDSHRHMQSDIGLVAERVERLLLRHDELHRTNTLLNEQIRALEAERDSLRSRLSAARARVEALIGRLPDNAAPTSHGTLR